MITVNLLVWWVDQSLMYLLMIWVHGICRRCSLPLYRDRNSVSEMVEIEWTLPCHQFLTSIIFISRSRSQTVAKTWWQSPECRVCLVANRSHHVNNLATTRWSFTVLQNERTSVRCVVGCTATEHHLTTTCCVSILTANDHICVRFAARHSQHHNHFVDTIAVRTSNCGIILAVHVASALPPATRDVTMNCCAISRLEASLMRAQCAAESLPWGQTYAAMSECTPLHRSMRAQHVAAVSAVNITWRHMFVASTALRTLRARCAAGSFVPLLC